MKKKTLGYHRFAMLMASIVSTILILASSAIAYQITQVTDDETRKLSVTITDSGQIIWLGYDKYNNSSGALGRVKLFDGTKTITLSHPSMSDQHHAEIWFSAHRGNSHTNDNGQVVWMCSDGNDNEIFMYDGSEVIQLTDNSIDDNNPIINNSGKIVWHSGNPWYGENTINLWDGMNTIQLGSGDALSYTQINDRGDVIWSDGQGGGNVFLYDGTSTVSLGYGASFKLNNHGQVAGYFHGDGELNRVKLYDGTSLIEIDNLDLLPWPGRSGNGVGIAFNDRGQIAWWSAPRYYNIPSKLLFYDGTKTTELFQMVNEMRTTWPLDYSTRLNEQGHVIWSTKPYYQDLFSTFLYDGVGVKTIREIQSDPMWVNYPNTLLNDQGQMAWATLSTNGYEVNLYDGVTANQIYAGEPEWENRYLLDVLDINDKGELAWICTPKDGSHYQILTTATWNSPPVFDTIPAQDVTVYEGEILDFIVNAVDDEGDNLQYSISTLPVGASFDAISGTFTWLTDNSDAGVYPVSFYATDDGNPTMVGEITVDITVIDVPTAPELIDNLTTDLTDLNLPQQDMNVYSANLKKVGDLILEGKYTVAINQLNAFITKVAQDIAHNDAIAPVGQTYIDLANDLILLLENQ